MDQNSERNSPLGRNFAPLGLPNYEVDRRYVAVTISLPETKKFMAHDSVQQKVIYDFVVKSAIKHVKKHHPLKYFNTFEYTKKGKVHYHGVISYKHGDYNNIAFVNDLAKYLCSSIKFMNFPIKYDKNRFFNNDYGVTYQCPAFKLDTIEDKEDYDKWVTYIIKDIVKNERSESE